MCPRQHVYYLNMEKEGYWNSERFMKNVEDAVKIAEFKYPPHRNIIVFIFDQSSCHKAYAEDALNASRMNERQAEATMHA